MLRTRGNFAVHHLRAAKRAAHGAYEVERDNATAEHGPWFGEMLTSVPVSVVMAGAALEANANEIVQDILDGSTGLPVTEGRKLLLEGLKEDRSGNSLDRYRQLALLFDKVPAEGEAAWQNARLLVRFRNKLMRFKPAWDDEKGVHDDKFVKDLKSRVPVYRAYDSGFLFPYGFMTYECARWSVQTVLAFSAHFSALLGVQDRFGASHLDFALPRPCPPIGEPKTPRPPD